tara:strand:+ start:476 stop:964 length:489 start_codon:yes stop_codon:yes gene_type:complete
LYGWARAKRSGTNLVDYWDDIHSVEQRSWKVKREKQYRVGKRGERRECYVEQYRYPFPMPEYEFEKYCKANDIPYDIEEVYKRVPVTEYETKRTTIVSFGDNYSKYFWSEYRYHSLWGGSNDRWEETGETRIAHYIRLVGYKLTWWSNKDIGINHVLNSASR